MSLNFANNNSLSAITTKPSGLSGGTMNLISTQTASSSSTISFTSGIDSTYDEYVFKFYDIHPATDSTHFQFNMSVDGGSNYNVTKTSTMFRAWHKEDDSAYALAYDAGYDLAQSTAFQPLAQEVSNDNDNDCVGTLTIYNPSSTTFVKHFISTLNMVNAEPITMIMYGAGYGNTTSAVDAVQFKMSSGNIDSGVIKLYGVS
ncbi:hypothetical protein [uncultured Mediterranean phage uvMED]|nr:hypothetical protein [uncultured Mediterranean phage uvMED]